MTRAPPRIGKKKKVDQTAIVNDQQIVELTTRWTLRRFGIHGRLGRIRPARGRVQGQMVEMDGMDVDSKVHEWETLAKVHASYLESFPLHSTAQ